MTVDRAINVLVTIALVELMIALGLHVAWRDIWGTVRNVPLMVKTLLANYLCVPLITVGLLAVFQPSPMISVGFLVLAACPGAPFAPAIAGLAKGDVPVAVGLMAVLALSSAIAAPAILSLLIPVFNGSDNLTIDGVSLLKSLGLFQLIPLIVGMLVRQVRPRWADRLKLPADRLSLILNLSALAAIVATQYPALSNVRPRGVLGMFVLISLSLASGWLLGGPINSVRRSLARTTSLRNLGLCLVVATGAFPGSPVATVVVAYGLLGIAASMAVATWWSRSPLERQPTEFCFETPAVKDDDSSHERVPGMVESSRVMVPTEVPS